MLMTDRYLHGKVDARAIAAVNATYGVSPFDGQWLDCRYAAA